MKKWDEETPLVIFIDEIQYLEDPTPFLKYLHDHYPNLKIVIS
ncbi:AAA family ATPase [bacterium]|nr:AAA family ATPase [bacterium]